MPKTVINWSHQDSNSRC